MVIIFLVVILFVVLFLGFVVVVGSSILNWVFDEATPELTNLGMVGDANMTDIASFTITPLNTLVQSFTWITGVLYVMVLVGSLGVVFLTDESTSKWLIGFYVVIMLLLIMGSIYISNIYEDFYDGTDALATRLKEHTVLSFMVLYSPTIFTIIGFIAGVILFSGIRSEGSL